VAEERSAVGDLVLKAYRWQYIVTGVQEPRFGEVLKELVTPAQMQRIGEALAPIVAHVNDCGTACAPLEKPCHPSLLRLSC
jgi:hypothetical protein